MLDDIKKTLWATADKLRANMDAAEYKHLVLGLIFLKYVSDTFAARQAELRQRLRDPDDEYITLLPRLISGQLRLPEAIAASLGHN
jgi:type I restriction enzyme M protein